MAQYSEFPMCIVHPKLLHTLGICPPLVTPDICSLSILDLFLLLFLHTVL